MNNKTKAVIALVLLVLVSAIGLRNLATSAQASDTPVNMAIGGPVPPPPWKIGGPVPPPPWKIGGPVPPPPWKAR